MLLATPEQRRCRLDFPCAGAFRSFGRQKNMKERLEENTSEWLRLETAVNIMVSESDTDTVFLRPFLNILLSEFLIYMLIHTKFLLSRNCGYLCFLLNKKILFWIAGWGGINDKRLTKKALFSLRLPSKCSFTLSKLRFFGLRKP